MVNHTVARFVSLAILCCALTLVPVSFHSAAAAGLDHGRTDSGQVSPFANFIDLLSRVWTDLVGLSVDHDQSSPINATGYDETGPQTDSGYGLDPDGLQAPGNDGPGASSDQ